MRTMVSAGRSIRYPSRAIRANSRPDPSTKRADPRAGRDKGAHTQPVARAAGLSKALAPRKAPGDSSETRTRKLARLRVLAHPRRSRGHLTDPARLHLEKPGDLSGRMPF